MKAVMVTTKENAKFLIDELGDEITKEDVVIKLVSDQEFISLTSKKVDIEVDLNDSTFMQLAQIAHERDITFNQLCNEIIKEELDRSDNEVR